MLEVSFNVRIGKVGSSQRFIDPKCTIQFFCDQACLLPRTRSASGVK